METRYSPYYDFIKKEKDGTCLVGFTDKSLNSLEDIVFLTCSPIGSYVKKGEEVGVMESSKAAFEIIAPLSGKIIAVNEALLIDTLQLKTILEENRWFIQLLPDPHLFEKEWDELLLKELSCGC